jgi:hypothetical protein
MEGAILIFRPGAKAPEIKVFGRALDLADVKEAIGGGWIEKVSGFETIEHDGSVRPCVVLVDEEGKLDYRTSGADKTGPDPYNPFASILWDKALRRAGHRGLIASDGDVIDYLSGIVCVVIGDEQFLRSL